MVDESEVALKKVKLAIESPIRIFNSLEVFNLLVTFSVESSRWPTISNYVTLDEPIQLKKETNHNKRAALVEILKKHFRERFTVMWVDRCASMLCLRDHITRALKLVAANDSDPIADAVNVIADDLQTKRNSTCASYSFTSFNFDTAVDDTSESILHLISGLVSNGLITAQSLSLVPSLQSFHARDLLSNNTRSSRETPPSVRITRTDWHSSWVQIILLLRWSAMLQKINYQSNRTNTWAKPGLRALWGPSTWSAYHIPVRANNDVEGWHYRLNQKARKSHLDLYLLIRLLHDEAECVDLHIRLLSDRKLTKRVRRPYGKLHQQLRESW